jgi:hypothetical protein
MAYESHQSDFFPLSLPLFMLKNLIRQTSFFHRRLISTIELTRNAISNQPIKWKDLIKWINEGQKTLLWRDEQSAQRYIEHQRLVAKDYRSINDFIRIHYLKWDVHFDQTIQKRIAISGLQSIKEPLLTPNDFPYYLVKNIQHWLIWCDPKPVKTEEMIEQILNKNFPLEKFERLSFVNPPRLRSVSDVFHAHIFTRKIQF